MPGDVVNVEVYAKYVDPNADNWNDALTNLMSAIASNTGGIVAEGGSYSTSTASFQYAGASGATGTDGTAPKAYLNWLVFDRDFNLIIGKCGYARIPESAREAGSDVPHQRMYNPVPITIDKPGYVYLYFSNENDTQVEVFFDDFKVAHTQSPIVQMDDYPMTGASLPALARWACRTCASIRSGLRLKAIKESSHSKTDGSFKSRNGLVP